MLIKTWNEKTIRWREDGFGCLTDMAKATGKQVSDWMRLKNTNAYLKALSDSRGITVGSLIDTNISEGQNDERGTWADRRVCIRFAQWCSPEFAVQVDLWVEEIMTKGHVDIRNMSSIEALHHMTGQMVQLERQQKQIELEVTNLQIQQLEASIKLKTIDEQLEDLLDRNSALEAEMERVINPYGSYYTVMGYGNRIGNRNLTNSVAINLGRQATRYCQQHEIPIEKVNDPRFGYVGSYPETVLEQVFNNNN